MDGIRMLAFFLLACSVVTPYCVAHPYFTTCWLRRGVILVDFPLMPISLIQPVANIAWEFKRHEDIQNAK